METEKQPPKNMWIDKMDNINALGLMLKSQAESIIAIQSVLKEISGVIEVISRKLMQNNNSRLIYVGAGTSARIGVQDGTELFPTFGWPKDRVNYIIAGGFKALTESIENAEDDVSEAKKMVKNLFLNDTDIIIALSASGNTPFTISAVNEANKRNAITIGIGNNPNANLQKCAKYGITLDTGFEILGGSTRLKAGTSQKICLNLISTLVMSNLGNIKNGQMINFVPMNKKLRNRKKIMIQNIN